MIFADQRTERAIAGYSITYSEAIRKAGVDIDCLTYNRGSFKSFLKLLPRLKNYDVIHIQHEYNLMGGYSLSFLLAYIILALSKEKRKIVTTMHSIVSKNDKLMSKNKIVNFIRKHILYPIQNKIIALVSNRIISHAQFLKDILVKEYGILEDKIVVMQYGILEDVFRIDKVEAKKKLKLKGSVYLIIGNFVPAHGADVVIKQAKGIGPTILIVANPAPVNDGNKKRVVSFLEQVQNYVKENNLGEYVRFDIGNITDSHPNWWIYFNAADLVVLAYRGSVPGSGIFAHAMATRTPVITSDVPFFKEIWKIFKCVGIAEGDNFARAIKEAMKPKNLEFMRSEADRYAKKFSLSNTGKRYKELYESLLK